MKRLFLGIGILLTLFGGGTVICQALEGIHEPIAAYLQQATNAALSENWASAQDLLEHAAVRWEHFRHFIAAFSDHTPMDEVDGLFRELRIYGRLQEMPHFTALCAHIQECIQSFRESHQLSWWNLLLYRYSGQ